ncbi:MAG: flagellar assembly protein FliW [Deltaproteobacteria bacterium]|nr:flagellar assembly protein FliW [Deltaproteobacteria bacterium]
MKVETTRFGTIQIADEKIIFMPQGVLGFPQAKRFCILQHKPGSPFFWLQAVDDPALAFVMTNPWLFKPDYEVDVKPAGLAMGWHDDETEVPVECYVIVTIPKGAPDKMTANLMGPVLINPKTREAVQIVLSNESYPHNYPLAKNKAA